MRIEFEVDMTPVRHQRPRPTQPPPSAAEQIGRMVRYLVLAWQIERAVAEGRAHIYPRFGPTCLWDTAAGTAIATVAGCAAVDLSGNPLRYDPTGNLKHPGFLIAAPGECLEACRPALMTDIH